LQGSNDGGLTENARALAGLLQARPQGSTRFVELEVRRQGPHMRCLAVHLPRALLLQPASTRCTALLEVPPQTSSLPPRRVQGVGHAPMDETPERLNRLLIEFVKQVVDP
jgi:pimeloyl-ACP methyl ester carboxylesterase